MSVERTASESPFFISEPGTLNATVSAEPTLTLSALDALEDVDFLLEEIENKIAPLALA